ncbi:18910_t:CDS:2 [Acaulospora morrowiae]|uniref:18910_t:CDS:1 n=1 Tax=Acaulospora morrowiae TaxID=94023 RepID=A0A9N9G7Q3_9GLOM|nr:18910_t:CDS:2 [Acaulospora morrowiae]
MNIIQILTTPFHSSTSTSLTTTPPLIKALQQSSSPTITKPPEVKHRYHKVPIQVDGSRPQFYDFPLGSYPDLRRQYLSHKNMPLNPVNSLLNFPTNPLSIMFAISNNLASDKSSLAQIMPVHKGEETGTGVGIRSIYNFLSNVGFDSSSIVV